MNASASGSGGWLLLEGLSKSYGAAPALIGFSRSIGRGERLILAGPNGAGKSTLLRLLAGLSRPGAGRLLAGGRPLDRDYRAGLGYLDHRSFLYDHLTGAENLRFHAALHGVGHDGADRLLERVGLACHAASRVAGYSRGMRQRLSLARALLGGPEILLLDEPFSGLDEQGVALALELLGEWLGTERTLIVASHDFEKLSGVASGLLVLDRGRLVADLPAAALDGAALREAYRAALQRGAAA